MPFLLLQAFIFVVKTILASGTYREFLKESAAKKVEKLLSKGKILEAKKSAKMGYQGSLIDHRSFLFFWPNLIITYFTYNMKL